jgi:hypothetical protein
VSCAVCGAPPLPFGGDCVFCRTPLAGDPDPAGLLDYLSGRLPSGQARHGLFGRGPVRELTLDAGGRRFRGRIRKGTLVLEPTLPPAEWCEALLGALRFEAASDHELRRQLARSGWDFAPR